ncbi:MAG: GIY-YIG nuclease family protein [Vulcanimicrobiaceae bacterium]
MLAAIIEAVETITSGVPYAVEQLDELFRRTFELINCGELPTHRPLRHWRDLSLQSLIRAAIPVLQEVHRIDDGLRRIHELIAATWAVPPPDPDPLPPDGQFVYLFGAEGFLKIGFTSNVRGRFSNIRDTIPMALTVLGLVRGGRSLEKQLHQKFADHRYRGEWYRDVPEIRSFFATHPSRVGTDPAAFATSH